ncbi:hypothetical protein HY643_01285, partial [Candidatus Woesearchaeota archaeon]|nr:hypothetical protein [Candidatus Woesearchaeota archaeon]
MIKAKKIIKSMVLAAIAAPLLYIGAKNLYMLGEYFYRKPSQVQNMLLDYFQDKTKLKDYELTQQDEILNYLTATQKFEEYLTFGEKKKLTELEGKTKKEKRIFEDRLEQLIECDLSLMMGKKVNLITQLQRTNSLLLMSKRNGRGFTNFSSFPALNPFMYRYLSDYEKLAVENLAEGLGEKAKKIDVDADYTSYLSELYKQNFENPSEKTSEAITQYSLEVLTVKFGLTKEEIKENKKNYAAYVAQIGGLTINSPLIQLINIGDQLGTLHTAVAV